MAAERESPVRLANDLWRIEDACRELGMDVYDGSERIKYWCPFGDVLHADGGRSKAFRVYGHTNSAYCWACGIYFTPVRLIAMDKDITELEAAQWILDHVDYRPPDFVSRWDAVTTVVPEPDREALTEALRIFCARTDPRWEERQLIERIAKKYRQCLALLPKVQTEEDARKWMQVAKAVMSKELTR